MNDPAHYRNGIRWEFGIGVTLLALIVLPSINLGANAYIENRSPIANCSTETVDSSDHDKTVLQLQRIYQSEKFELLESSLSCLLRPTFKFDSGRPGSSAIYDFFKRTMPGPGTDAAEIDRVRKWEKQNRKSIFARFGKARFEYSMAWNSRGRSFAQNVSEESWKAFHAGLLRAEQDLLEAPDELRNTPIWQHLLLAVSQDAMGAKSKPRVVFEEGIKRWPGYYGFYENMLRRLVPKWGGSWKIVDESISTWSSQRAATEGRSLYARLYASVLMEGAKLGQTLIQWPTTKASLNDLTHRYPDNYNWNLAASYACLFHEAKSFKEYVSKFYPQRVMRSAWFKGSALEGCMQRLQ